MATKPDRAPTEVRQLQLVSFRCPGCSELLTLSSDMWGLYYLCATCGFTAEDDDQVVGARTKPMPVPPGFIGAEPPSPPLMPARTR